jgi:hypothetical protein
MFPAGNIYRDLELIKRNKMNSNLTKLKQLQIIGNQFDVETSQANEAEALFIWSNLDPY